MSDNTRSKVAEVLDVDDSEEKVFDLIKDQNKKLYEIQKQKIEAELKILNVKLAKEQLKLICLQREFDARIAAISASLSISERTGTKRKENDDDESDEISSKVKVLSLRFAGLPQEEIVRIFFNKFKPINLYRLRHMRDRQYEEYLSDEKMSFEKGILRIKKSIGTYKDYEKFIHDV
jgi:hypothetical protein